MVVFFKCFYGENGAFSNRFSLIIPVPEIPLFESSFKSSIELEKVVSNYEFLFPSMHLINEA